MDHPTPLAGNKPRILVVENEAIVACDIRLQLVELGYEPVGRAVEGEHAVALAGELRPDLVLMDIQLAGAMDGIAAAHAIRTQFSLPVVFLTAFAEEDTLARAMLTEPFGYVLKPFSERELRTVIEMALYKHKAEARLRESEARYRAMVHAINDGVVSVDSAGHIVGWNPGAERMFGYPEIEALGQPVTLLLPARYHDRHLAGMARVQSGGDHHMIGRTIGLEGRRKDGSEFPLSLCLSAWHVAAGTFFTAILHDITERKRAEETLERLNQQHELILCSAAEGILGLDMLGNHRFVNPAAARMLGYEAEELLGLPGHSTWHHTKPDGSPCPTEECQIYSAYRDGEVHRVSNEVFWRKDGSSFPVEYASTPIYEQGRLTGAVVTFTEITERLLLEAQFLQAQKMESVGQLASGIAHDFNNLLTVINGTSELLLEQVSRDDPVHADVQEIHQAGERAATLTRQLLAFSRQQMLEPRVLNFNTVVAGMESLLRRLLGEDIELVVVPAQDLGRVKADPGQIEQVITNLVVNARDAMPRGGRLTIETENVTIDEAYARGHGEVMAPGSYVRLTVSDSGVGMDEATRARVFEPFFTTKGPGKGTGLGLSTVYGIVRQSHGFIWVYSEVGQGTSVQICLPEVTEAAGTERPEPAAVSSRGTETILLVEDNAGLRKLAVRVLKPAGYTVLEATAGEEALAVLERQDAPVHLVLTDVVMPGMSGRELAERIARTHPAMKVLYMSGYTADTVVRHGVLDAQMPFLHKPFTAAALLQEVREVLDSPA